MKSHNFFNNTGTLFACNSSFSHKCTVKFSTVHLGNLHKRMNQYVPNNKS